LQEFLYLWVHLGRVKHVSPGTVCLHIWSAERKYTHSTLWQSVSLDVYKESVESFITAIFPMLLSWKICLCVGKKLILNF